MNIKDILGYGFVIIVIGLIFTGLWFVSEVQMENVKRSRSEKITLCESVNGIIDNELIEFGMGFKDTCNIIQNGKITEKYYFSYIKGEYYLEES